MSETVQIDKDELQSLIDERVAAQLDEHKQRRSRRSVLASLAGAAGLGAMGYGWIADVRATDGSAVGQIGTPSDKVNVYAHSLGDPNNPVDEFYVEDEFVTDTQQSLTVDDLTVNQSASIDELNSSSSFLQLLTDLDINRNSIQFDSDPTVLTSGRSQTISDGSAVQLYDQGSQEAGMVLISDAGGRTAIILTDNGSNSVTIVGQSRDFTTTSGNSGTNNVYFSSTNSQFELENQRGVDLKYGIVEISSGG